MEIVGRPDPPTGVRRVLFRLPIWLYRARLGAVLGSRFVLINHVGRKSGMRRQVVVEVVGHDPQTGKVTVAAGFGRTSDWYRNLLAHPDARIRLGRRSMRVHAVALSPEQSAAAMLAYARRHPRAALRLSRFMGFSVDGGADDYRAVGQELSMVRLDPA